MLTLEKAQQIINSEIKKRKIITEPQDLYNPINYILSLDGKRIRPSLCLMACNLFSDEYSNALGAALALEVFHNFTLLHDDIMDKANLRRGNPTVHKKWNNNVAILSGDAMCIKAYEYLATTQPDKIIKVFKLFNCTALQVCEGQQFDMEYEDQPNVTIVEYMKMIALKTSVLIASCLEIGAIIGGASDLNAHHLYNFGLNAGLAFQLQDDLLDIFGDEQHFGKEIGKDIISNEQEFREKIKLEMAKNYDIQADKKFFNDVVTNLIEKTEVKLPDEFLKRWLYEINEGKFSKEQIESEYDVYAKSLKWQLIENKLITENKINVTEQDAKDFIINNFIKPYKIKKDEEMENENALNEIALNVLKDQKESEKIYERIYHERLIEVFKNNINTNKKEVDINEFIKLASEKEN